jgi:hypothetical protein
MSSNDRCLVRYFGRDSEVRIADEIERIDDGCFCFSEIAVVTFGPRSRLSSIGVEAFSCCGKLKVMSIPSSVTFLGDYCLM